MTISSAVAQESASLPQDAQNPKWELAEQIGKIYLVEKEMVTIRLEGKIRPNPGDIVYVQEKNNLIELKITRLMHTQAKARPLNNPELLQKECPGLYVQKRNHCAGRRN